MEITRQEPSEELARTTRRLLDTVPQWFAHSEENVMYVDAARRLPGYLATVEDEPVGIVLEARHFPASSEIFLLAVDAAHHRTGAGRALVAGLESALRADGCRFLQVKTLGPSHPDAGYARTRAFYAAVGFEPLEETDALWDHDQPCLFMIKYLG